MTRTFRTGNLRVDVSLHGNRVLSVAYYLPNYDMKVLSDEGLDSPDDAQKVFDAKCASFLYVEFQEETGEGS